MTKTTVRRWSLALVAGGLALSNSSCSPPETPTDSKEMLTLNSIDELSKDTRCIDVQVLHGDPDFYGPAAGLHCVLDGSSAIVLRAYDDPGAVAKIIGNWDELINEENQLVYAENWFATGPKNALEEMFGRYEKHGPQTVVPATSEMTDPELEATLCSSLTYYVVQESITGAPENELQQYFDNYPGMLETRNFIVKEAKKRGLNEPAEDSLETHVFLTQFDAEVKDLCSSDMST